MEEHGSAKANPGEQGLPNMGIDEWVKSQLVEHPMGAQKFAGLAKFIHEKRPIYTLDEISASISRVSKTLVKQSHEDKVLRRKKIGQMREHNDSTDTDSSETATIDTVGAPNTRSQTRPQRKAPKGSQAHVQLPFLLASGVPSLNFQAQAPKESQAHSEPHVQLPFALGSGSPSVNLGEAAYEGDRAIGGHTLLSGRFMTPETGPSGSPTARPPAPPLRFGVPSMEAPKLKFEGVPRYGVSPAFPVENQIQTPPHNIGLAKTSLDHGPGFGVSPAITPVGTSGGETPNFGAMNRLMDSRGPRTANPLDSDIEHAPLVSGATVLTAAEQLPQYGLLGTNASEEPNSPASYVFVNTNVPFSAFIYGVQGSGKSHTTSCFLENSLLSSPALGKLQQPLSALVLSYGDYGSTGSFNISEAAWLAVNKAGGLEQDQPTVKRVTVLTSPTNPEIREKYEQLPNVKAIPFKLQPQKLDVGTMLTLMAVNSAGTVPLYMTQVTQILRDMASQSVDGFNYPEFKARLSQSRFDRAQQNMLELRLGALESFLDLSNSSTSPTFAPGEVTIMDMSCPFVDATTACVLFKLGLKMYLDSHASGKMVVLDEAHKYMLDNPGARDLTEYVRTIVRLQRHFGARVIVSTQEPTILTDLIALSSMTVIHRFTSPEWLAALAKHVPITVEDGLEKIGGLRRGEAFIYAPTSVLGKNDDGSLVKGTGKFLEVKIRDRMTADGGVSKLAV